MRLLVIGGAHVDRQARLASPHRPGTSNPVSVHEEAGGGGLNAARAALRFGIAPTMLSARGADAAGALVEETLRNCAIADLSTVHLDRPTPSYTAILEPDGELVTAIADMALYEAALAKSLCRASVAKATAEHAALLCDANITTEAARHVLALAAGKPAYALAISAGKVARLKPHADRFTALFMNRYEAEVLTGLAHEAPAAAHARALAAVGLQRAVVSAGGSPAAILDGGDIVEAVPPEVAVRDVTGAGDALAGTTVSCHMQGMGFAQAARLGLAAASLTAARAGAAPEISRREIEALAAAVAMRPA